MAWRAGVAGGRRSFRRTWRPPVAGRSEGHNEALSKGGDGDRRPKLDGGQSAGGLAVLDEQQYVMNPGDVLDIPVGATHRIGNKGKENLVFIEVACGAYLGEDDIERIQDDYERQPPS